MYANPLVWRAPRGDQVASGEQQLGEGGVEGTVRSLQHVRTVGVKSCLAERRVQPMDAQLASNQLAATRPPGMADRL